MRVLVTGGSKGIGKAIVQLFEHNGHSVYSPSRSKLDLTQTIDLQDRKFDIVVNNAGINPLTYIKDISDEEVMKVNYLSPLQIIQQCLPYMIDQKYG